MWFGMLLTVLFLVTGVAWLADKFYFAPQRKKNAEAIFDKAKASGQGGYDAAVRAALARPAWLEYTAGLFGVIALVFVLRSFIVEPFRIPSGSMLPNLYVGDFILVNKYTYGLRMPITNDVIVPMNQPKKGDVVVFQFPPDPSQSYIKRVVGVPGDVVRYENKVLTVNGQTYQQMPKSGIIPDAEYPTYPNTNKPVLGVIMTKAAEEGAVTHDILTIEKQPTINPNGLSEYPFSKNTSACTYFPNNTGMECKVPAGQYLMMGDNRDNSTDGRYWGFVPEQNIVGKAYFVWMNFSHLSRIGTSIQ
ncbi:MAG: signal peptidase I [Burkholderiales bacterium]|nr:signal peptidase I [Burkholderiales bacterium]MCE1176159.1 signal peptidase I [Burkholderiales bacterium]